MALLRALAVVAIVVVATYVSILVQCAGSPKGECIAIFALPVAIVAAIAGYSLTKPMTKRTGARAEPDLDAEIWDRQRRWKGEDE